jgi:hypothetical protein
MPIPGRSRVSLGDDGDWFETNAPTTPAGPAAPDPNAGAPPAAWASGPRYAPNVKDIDAAYLKYLGRARGANENTYLNDPNFLSNLYKTEEAQNFRKANPAPAAGGAKPSPQAFIAQWQQSHPPDIGALADAMKAAGYTNVSRFMYGATPSGNELSIDGQKYKVLSGENSGNPSWYTAGTDDSGGGQGGGQNQPFTPPPAWTESFTAPNFKGPTSADLDADVGYQEILKRGQQAIERSAASRGTVLNPGTLKDLSDWTAGTASQEMDKLYGRKWNEYSADVNQRGNEYGQRYKQYLDAYTQAAGTFGINYGVWNDDVNRFIDSQKTAFNQQFSLANLGMMGANGQTLAGTNYANQGGNAITGGANAQASGIVGSANSWNQGLGNIGNNIASLYALSQYGNYQPGRGNTRPYDPYAGQG